MSRQVLLTGGTLCKELQPKHKPGDFTMQQNGQIRIGAYICDCGVNISQTVDVERISREIAKELHVVVAREYRFMCSDPGQEMIKKDIREHKLNRIVVAACSPQMHELTFRNVCEEAGINRYLFQMANIREQCSWIHDDRAMATQKTLALVTAAVRRVALHEELEPYKAKINPNVLIVGAGIAGIQAALEIAESGNKVYLVERESTIGGNMAKFDKTFPTLDCSSCILTPKMTSVSHRKNITLMSFSEVEKVSGYIGNFKAIIKKKARYVNEKCTSCGDCTKVCPVQVPNAFDESRANRTAIHKAFPQAVPNTYVIDKQERPPCTEACPIRQEAAGYVALIREGRFHEAAQLIHKKNPLPVVCGRVCYHPCETECNRGYVDKPVAIQYLKRFAIDWELEHNGKFEPPRIEVEKPQKIAVIGSGPAGLTCAHDLALNGYKVTVFEQLPVIGGMLAVGIPEYRLPKKLLDMEVEYMRGMGIRFKTDMKLGSDFSIDDLRKEGYQAFFISIGAHKSVKLEVKGEDLEGVISGIEFLRRVNLGMFKGIGKHVGVVGGGNTAIDAARTALRMGAEKVSILYRRTKAEMPAAPHEIEDAEAEGIQIAFLTSPVEILGKNGKVVGVNCIRMQLGEPDASGRRRPVPVPDSEHALQYDTIIIAISQSPDLNVVNGQSQLKLSVSHYGTLDVDLETLQTNIPFVFAGGDVVLGPSTVIASMGAGRRAAESIDKVLSGERLENFKTHMVKPAIRRGEDFRPHAYAPMYKDTPQVARIEMPKRDEHVRRRMFAEVELGYSEDEAIKEASRCLSCGVCVECYECERVCQPGAVDHKMKDEEIEVEVGQILISTGYDILDPHRITQYGYGKLENVYTSLEFERMLSSTGPSGGNIRLKNGVAPRSVAILHCVGSRDENYNKYCSRVCCMYALKFAHLVKDRTQAEVYQFYIDMRSGGKGYEEFYKRVLNEGVNVIRGKVAEIVESPKLFKAEGKLLVRCEDTLIGKFREIPVDMVVLCNALEPRRDAARVAKIFGINRSADGFFLERHPKLDPVATMSDGIFIAGCAQSPKDIPDSVAQASAAAARMLATISKGRVDIDPIRAWIDEKYCSGCRICNNLCPYSAIEYDEQKNVSKVNDVVCKGCGTCVAACPATAISAKGFSDKEILAEMEGLLSVL
jgi:heterodisulfide reductase subunit A